MNLFWCFVTPMKLNCNAWHRWGTKMVQFRLDNSSSKYSSISPYLVSPERPISILADIILGIYFPWRFMLMSISDRPLRALFWLGGNQVIILVYDWSNVPNSSLGWPCNGLFTFSWLRFSLQICYFTTLLGISSRIMEYVMYMKQRS